MSSEVLVATVTPEAAWLSVTAPRSRQESQPAQLVGMAPKLLALPSARLALAGTGQRLPLLAVAGEVALLAGARQGFDDIAPGLPAYLAAMARHLPEDQRHLTVVLAGWSTRQQRALGYAFTSGEGFAPRELSGHSWAPQLNPDGPGYSRLRLLARTAAAGELTLDFHGQFAANVGATGAVWCARVDRHGVSQRQIASRDVQEKSPGPHISA